MKKQIGSFELENGTVVENIRIGLKDKLQLERTARVRSWEPEKDVFTTTAFLVWHAAKRLGHTELSYDDFVKDVEDAQLSFDEDPATEVDPLADEMGLVLPSVD